jgi:hypothetical protein
MDRESVVIAIAAEKVRRTKRPVIPGARDATPDHQMRMMRAQRAFDAGEAVYDVNVLAELSGEYAGTAAMTVESVLESDLSMVAIRAIGTLANGITEQIAAAQVGGDAEPSRQ